MPARNDHGSGTTGAGGDSPQEPLIDRQLELDLLRQHIARVADTGNGHAVLILGESGVGKSRLAVEAAAKARQRGMAVISVRCLGRGAEPLLPLKEALAGYLGRTPDQIRRTLARAAPPCSMRSRSSGRSWPASAKSSPKAPSASGESTKNYHASSSRPPPEMQGCFSWSMTCMRLTRIPCIS